jgi:hypothetical protein
MMIQERQYPSLNGLMMLLVLLAAFVASVYGVVHFARADQPGVALMLLPS